ncbi:FkbM family methyltransferase [Streptomyces albofaciens JCM 4342]|uniref:FkbM family methyltransferase n=1 Tax=Streptomyces albofaciens TaxID=66866 RepID=UPI000A5F07FB|nr:FkbM family methyltransferase [Streptomyces albofaciens]KAA6215481.1 FkbM family methyltransferase [Streptomyces albofaciens JCM 4342]
MTSLLTQFKLDLSRWYVRYVPGTLGKAGIVNGFLNSELRDHPRIRRARARFGATFVTDTQDLIQRYIYLFGVWEPHLTRWLQRRLRPGDVFVDVGANIGYYSLLASRLVGDMGAVVALEASPDFHRVLLKQAAINGCGNVRAVNTAISDRDEMLTFVLASSHNMGANSIVPYAGEAESTFEVAAQPLSDVLSSGEIARARVIKVDVEGAEGAVVRGLVPLLDQLRPDVELAIEVTPQRMLELGDSADELLGALRANGFHMYRLQNDYAAGRYPAALRHGSEVPIRWREPITEESELLFSRVDAEYLP